MDRPRFFPVVFAIVLLVGWMVAQSPQNWPVADPQDVGLDPKELA